MQGLCSTLLTFFLLYSTGYHIHNHSVELKRAQYSLYVQSELANLIQSASATESILKYRVYYGSSAVMTNITDTMAWISILSHLGNIFCKKASFVQYARFDNVFVGYYNDTFEVTEKNITKLFKLNPNQQNFQFFPMNELRFVREMRTPYQTLARPWVKEFYNKNTSRPYWTYPFTNVYGQRAVSFVLPIFVKDHSFRQTLSSFLENSYFGNATFRYDTPFLRIDNLIAMVGIQFTVDYLSDFLKNLTSNSEILSSFIVNTHGEILGSTSRNDTLNQDLSSFIFNNNKNWSSVNVHSSPLPGTNVTFEYKNFMVKILPLEDDYGLNWLLVIAFAKGKNYIDEIFTQGVSAVVLFIVLFILQVLVLFCILQYISHTLYHMTRSIHKILRFQALEKTCKFGSYSIFLDFREMNHSLNKLKMGLQEFRKYVPHIIEKNLNSITVPIEQEIETSKLNTYRVINPMSSMKPIYMRKKLAFMQRTPYLSTLKPYSEIGMKSREMIVMFCGISNFATLSETANNSTFTNMVTDVFCTACHLIELHFGVVDKIVDGTIMAFWNDESFHESHEIHACRAALEIIEELKQIEEKPWKTLYGTKPNSYPKFEMTIGINSGKMLCGCMGSPSRFNYTVIGENVNIASRLQYLAQSYRCQIIIGENVQKVVQKEFTCFFVDFIKLRGKLLPTSVYCLATFSNEASDIQRKLALELEMAKEYLLNGDYYHLRQVCEKLVLLFMINDNDDLSYKQIEFDAQHEHKGCMIPLLLLHRSIQLMNKAGCDALSRSSSSYWNNSQCSDCLSYPCTTVQ
ncbi:hypothetical protein FDP41_001958 [Naegleria fowleri]|uniref:Guanylate cyclase domain-containing protein n=1 Tax=Naegleria fowleri TaxID=5763 RepID=A0A6A5BYW2_NAEFO|nr:uncharacterized protein FDP41_001958 [Naegleria fowleri]KAF0978888.1 hypothetical protein FDP41_001958 [Naegleria fowleri]